MRDRKEYINLALNVILVICALVVTGLLGINTFLRFGKSGMDRTVAFNSLEKGVSYSLPEAVEIKNYNELFQDFKNKKLRGLPVALEFATIVAIEGRQMLFFPIIMSEPQIEGKLNFGLIDPMKWKEIDQFSQCVLGRRSLLYMPVGSKMLYGILLEPKFKSKKVGLGFIVVKRISDDIYDIILEDVQHIVYFAWRGKLKRLNERIGQGTLIPLENQDEVKEIYKPKWNLTPNDFILFNCSSCN